MSGKTRVLTVDADPTFRDQVKAVFAPDGYEVSEAADAGAGLLAAAKLLPQLLVVDMLMSRGAGCDFILAVRGRADLKHIPLIVASTPRSEEDAKQCRRLGADAFFPKPVDAAALRDKAKELMGHPR